MEPMLLAPVGKEKLWGGNRLKTEYNKHLDANPLAESWECSAHPNGPSVVINGKFSGMSLDKILEKHPEYLGTRVQLGKGLPILVKFIDAAHNLSVQVHPDDDYAQKHENSNGKTEMWYILDALPGARIIHGFKHNMTKEMLYEAIANGRIAQHLQEVPVQNGDIFFTPAGTIHGIGAGCLIAEIQENSDITYRVYDYDRKDKNGIKRELHFDKALEVLDLNCGQVVRQIPRMVHYYPGSRREILCRCKYFETEKVKVTQGMSFSVMNTSFQVILCLDGNAGLETSEFKKPLRFKKGDCLFLPAGLGRCFVIGECEFLKIRV